MSHIRNGIQNIHAKGLQHLGMFLRDVGLSIEGMRKYWNSLSLSKTMKHSTRQYDYLPIYVGNLTFYTNKFIAYRE